MGGSESSSGNDFKLRSERTWCLSSGKKSCSGELRLSVGGEWGRESVTGQGSHVHVWSGRGPQGLERVWSRKRLERGGVCRRTMQVSCTLGLTIGLEQWFSTRGDIVPLGTCDRVWRDFWLSQLLGGGFLLSFSGYREDRVVAKHSAVYGKTPASTKTCQPSMFLVLEVGTSGLERKGQKRGWSENGGIDCSDAYCLYCLGENYSRVVTMLAQKLVSGNLFCECFWKMSESVIK